MPYVQPKGPGIIPRKKVIGRIPRTKHPKQPQNTSTSGETSAQGLADQLASTHIAGRDESTQSPADQVNSARSSMDSQALSTAPSRKTTTTSSLSIPSLADGATTTPSSVSLASPKNPDLALGPDSDETELGDKGKNPTSASTSGISSPGDASLPSGAITPLTEATSLSGLDDNAQRLANYKEGLYAYTRNLYLQAQQSIQRKAAIENLPKFGLNKSGAEKKASKRATARRLSSFS